LVLVALVESVVQVLLLLLVLILYFQHSLQSVVVVVE
jgi:hypothetical protein